MSEVAASVHPGAPIAVLSGPTFAHEVAVGLPTAVTLACADRTLGDAIAARLARPQFRPYLSDDVIGAEIGGAVKNVLKSEEHTSELQSLMRNSYAVFCLKKK